MHPAHFPALFAKEHKGGDMPGTTIPANQILIPTQLHPCTALLIFALVLTV